MINTLSISWLVSWNKNLKEAINNSVIQEYSKVSHVQAYD